MYIVRLRIGDYHTIYETHEEFATLYRAGRSIVRFGKRRHIRTRVVIADALTGKTVVRFYSMKSKSAVKNGEWVAALSGIGKYKIHVDF